MRPSTVALALAAVVVAAAITPAVADNRYTWKATPGAFSVKDVLFESAFNEPFQEGTVCKVTITGETDKIILAGTTKFKLYEQGEQHFEAEGNLPYFKCNNKGCNTGEPVTLFLADPSAKRTSYEIVFDYTMGQAKSTGDFSLVIWGEDQDHSPYDFSVSLGYNYSQPELPALDLAPVVGNLRGSTPVPEAPETLHFSYNTTNGAMAIDSVSITSSTGKWQAGAKVSIHMTGVIANKTILAGTLKWKIYESFVRYFIDEGDEPYFDCTNKGCNPFDGKALHLNNPTKVPTDFYIDTKITLPRSIKGGRNPFTMVLWGVDQDHNPADFIVSLDYNLAAGR